MRIYNILSKTQECPSFRLSHTLTEHFLFLIISPLSAP